VTEKQWLKCRDPEAMLGHLADNATARKLRLFAVACCHHIAHLILDPRSCDAVKVAERLAEGKCSEDDNDVWIAREEAENAFNDDEFGKGDADARDAAFQVIAPVAFEAAVDTSSVAVCAAQTAEDSATCTEEEMESRAEAEEAAQAEMLHDIFGNPFRPVALDPAWLTSDVLALARGIYEERAFDRMPILADALQDAGCTNEDVLNHCRDMSLTHVRGCWVVDLLLGKT
jgi:hypothetical protein